VKKQDESIEVVMMTGYPTIASAVQALKEELRLSLQAADPRRAPSPDVPMMERKFLRGEIHTLRARLGRSDVTS